MNDVSAKEHDEIKVFLKQQSSMIRTLGSFGGSSRRSEIITNGVFFVVVVLAFAGALFAYENFYQRLFFEIGIMLISVKLAYFLYRFSKVAHFQFWALVALETKIDMLLKQMQENSAAAKEKNDGA